MCTEDLWCVSTVVAQNCRSVLWSASRPRAQHNAAWGWELCLQLEHRHQQCIMGHGERTWCFRTTHLQYRQALSCQVGTIMPNSVFPKHEMILLLWLIVCWKRGKRKRERWQIKSSLSWTDDVLSYWLSKELILCSKTKKPTHTHTGTFAQESLIWPIKQTQIRVMLTEARRSGFLL